MKKIDVHAHYGYWPFPILADSESDLLLMLAENEIEKCILSSAKAIQYDFVAGNRELKPILDRNQELYGYITLNPNYPIESQKEIDTYQSHPKFVGIKIHPSYVGQAIDSEENIAIIKMAEQANLPLLIHTYDGGDTAPHRLLKVREQCAIIPIIMAHMGGNNWIEGIETAASAPGIYLDVICSFYDMDKARIAIDRVGIDRLVFGTDLTLIHPAVAIGMFESARLTDDEQQKIYYTNAIKIFPKLLAPIK
ncbi:MAG: amidohydrolase family protein [bacterium]